MYKDILILFCGLLILLYSDVSMAVEPTPAVKKHWKQLGLLKGYTQQRLLLQRRGIDMPSPHPPNLSRLQETVLGKRTTTYLNALVILVDFSDNQADTVSHPPSAFEDLLFSEGTHSTGSMNDWYLENSYNQIGIEGVVTQWVRLPQSYSYYVNGQYGFGNYPMNAQKMAEDAVAAVDPMVDFANFDNDNDGYVDALFVVHAGEGRETSGSSNDIHSHSWVMSQPQTRDGVTLYGYTTEPELYGTQMVRMGVFGHEFGHALGLPDLYDTDYSSDGVGYWSMMSGGSWGGGGRTPVHFDAWSKKELGWLDPIVLQNDSSAIQLQPVETTQQAMRLWTVGQPGNEYFLLENRQHLGFDSALPGEGLLVWHIDESRAGNSDEWHKLVALEQADGDFDLENGLGSDAGDPYPGNTDNTSFTDLTVPNSNAYNNEYSFVGVTGIFAAGDLVEFDATVSYSIPYISLLDYSVSDGGWDGNQRLNSGEQDTLVLRLDNRGAALTNAEITLTSPNTNLQISPGLITMDSLPANAITELDSQFVVTVDTGASDWEMANFTLDIQGDGSATFVFDLSLIINQGYGIATDMESKTEMWSHYNVTDGFMDEWNLSTQRNHTLGGSSAWKVGDPEGEYGNSVDAALSTPALLLETDREYDLIFWHYMDAELDDTPGKAWDGGRVEISADAGMTWDVLTPPDGYPYTIMDNPASPFSPDTPVYSGSIQWTKVEIPLDGFSGEILIRFRFGSDGYVTEEGWYIDDLTVQARTPVAVTQGDPAPQDFMLGQNYPNPFNPATTIPFTVSGQQDITIEVYDILGHRVTTLVSEPLSPGKYTCTWDGRNHEGEVAGSGIYFIRMAAEEGVAVRKVSLLR